MNGKAAVRDLVQRIVEHYNAKDVESLIALYHEDAAYWSPLGDWQRGVGHIRSHLAELHRTLPDEQMSIVSLMADDECAVAEFASTGTAPSGESYRIEFTEVIDVRDGKIERVKVYLDPSDVAAITG